jgi:hypothetical protein
LCYRCHDPEYYERLNPHDQISDSGQLIEDRCRVCHRDTKDLRTATSMTGLSFTTDQDFSSLCTRCHKWVPHPGGFSFSSKEGPDHLVVPSLQMLRRLQRMEKKNNVMLPLEPVSGRIFCATCHNPHEKGVVRSAAADKGADRPDRLRMRDICTNCHDI